MFVRQHRQQHTLPGHTTVKTDGNLARMEGLVGIMSILLWDMQHLNNFEKDRIVLVVFKKATTGVLLIHTLWILMSICITLSLTYLRCLTYSYLRVILIFSTYDEST